jgi:hypothetical protein
VAHHDGGAYQAYAWSCRKISDEILVAVATACDGDYLVEI